MARYLLKRIVYFIFTLFVISLVAFAVTVSAPGDPADRLLSGIQAGQEMSNASGIAESQRMQLRHQLGLDLPLFYFSLQSAADPDTLYKVFPTTDRALLKKLLNRYGHWNLVSDYYRSILLLQDWTSSSLGYISFDNTRFNELLVSCSYLRTSDNDSIISRNIRNLESAVHSDSILQSFASSVRVVREQYSLLTESKKTLASYIPIIQFHRMNQYHRWLFGADKSGKGVMRGDFGVSYISGQPVGAYILDRLPWTVCLSLLSVLLAYAFSIPLATRMSKNPGGPLDRGMATFLYLLYSLPGFWLATLLLMVFANPDVWAIFPASGVKPVTGYPDGTNFIQQAIISLPYLVLPTICYTYAFVAVLTRLLRVSLQDTFAKDYIRTARAKGLGEKAVRLRHALPNALLPAITLFAEIFPLAIGGSIIIESIFTIPGMGSGIYQSIQNQDYPVLVCIFTLSGLLTMAGYLFTDIAYAFLDPRIRYGR